MESLLSRWVQGQAHWEAAGKEQGEGRRAGLTSASGKLRSWAVACVPKTGGKKNLPYLVKVAPGLGKGWQQTGGHKPPALPWTIGFVRAVQMCQGMDGNRGRLNWGEHLPSGGKGGMEGGIQGMLPAVQGGCRRCTSTILSFEFWQREEPLAPVPLVETLISCVNPTGKAPLCI